MDLATKAQIKALLDDAERRIPEAEKDIADMERAGLVDEARAAKSKLDDAKARIASMRAVYG